MKQKWYNEWIVKLKLYYTTLTGDPILGPWPICVTPNNAVFMPSPQQKLKAWQKVHILFIKCSKMIRWWQNKVCLLLSSVPGLSQATLPKAAFGTIGNAGWWQWLEHCLKGQPVSIGSERQSKRCRWQWLCCYLCRADSQALKRASPESLERPPRNVQTRWKERHMCAGSRELRAEANVMKVFEQNERIKRDGLKLLLQY